MWDSLQHLSYWNWLAVGTLLLILEVFGAGGYLLWIGLAAACVGVLTFLFPELPWTLQFILFGVLSVLTAVLWWRRQRSAAKPSDQPGLNRRGSELVGRQFVLYEAIASGRGKIKAGDTLWLVSGPDLPAGSQVRVIGQDGVLLKVEASGVSAPLLAPLAATQDGAALDLLDRAFASDPTLGWYLFAERADFAQRRRAYLAAYQRLHRANGMPILAAWQAGQLVGAAYFSLTGQHPSAGSLEHIGQAIRQQCGADCLARLDQLLEAFEQQPSHSGSARIEFIAVAPDRQGRGIGSSLLSQTLTQLRQQGCQLVALETGEPRNLALYRRHGFAQSGHLTLAGLHQYYLQANC